MELADDIAYGIHDLEDGIALNLITEKDWLNHVDLHFSDYERNGIKANIVQDLFSGKNRIRKKAISYLVNYFISQIEISNRNCFTNPLLYLQAVMSESLSQELEMFKQIVVIKVIETPEVQTLVYKGQQMILRLFDALANNPKRLLERKHYEKYLSQNNENDKQRVICDYIAGDTDEYATRLYHKIFTPSNGSVFDRL
jgi:dGTPase